MLSIVLALFLTHLIALGVVGALYFWVNSVDLER
jgi:hypothetical protein